MIDLELTHLYGNRFWSMVLIPGPNDCWLWQRGVWKGGYGSFRIADKKYQAHRIAWMLEYGLIPEGYYICHHCDNPSCVNPHHLFLGTQRDNVQDCISKGRYTAHDVNRNKTHCPQGHEYTPENVRLYKGMRFCRTCGRESSKEYYRLHSQHQREYSKEYRRLHSQHQEKYG